VGREFLSLSDTAKLLNVSRWTVWRLLREGRLRYFLVRGCKRVYLGDIQRFKRENQGPNGAGRCRM
jgi:excisionase family DNA binding protein